MNHPPKGASNQQIVEALRQLISKHDQSTSDSKADSRRSCAWKRQATLVSSNEHTTPNKKVDRQANQKAWQTEQKAPNRWSRQTASIWIDVKWKVRREDWTNASGQAAIVLRDVQHLSSHLDDPTGGPAILHCEDAATACKASELLGGVDKHQVTLLLTGSKTLPDSLLPEQWVMQRIPGHIRGKLSTRQLWVRSDQNGPNHCLCKAS